MASGGEVGATGASLEAASFLEGICAASSKPDRSLSRTAACQCRDRREEIKHRRHYRHRSREEVREKEG